MEKLAPKGLGVLIKVKGLLTNRNFILALAFVLGAGAGQFAVFTRNLTVPALAFVMAFSLAGTPTSVLFPISRFAKNAFFAMIFSYIILTAATILLARILIPEQNLFLGFVLIAAVPPGVAVIPFTFIRKGDRDFAFRAMAGTYFAALLITPAILLIFGRVLFAPLQLFITLVQLIIIPFVFSRVLNLPGAYKYVDKVRSSIINWGFFVVIYTVVGLNRDIVFGDWNLLFRMSIICAITTFGLAYALPHVIKLCGISQKISVSLVLFGTIKNAAIAATLAITLFNQEASVPAAVVSVFYVFYFIWLSSKGE